MAIPLSDNIQNNSNKPTDAKYGPYTSIVAAKSAIILDYRYRGLTVGILLGGSITEYWWKSDIGDGDLEIKQTGGGSGGADGLSAYQIWLNLGNEGTEQDFINSLQGEDGYQGEDGKSAYQLAVANGYVGTITQWIASLKGEPGKNGLEAPVVQTTGTSVTNVMSQDASTKSFALKAHVHAGEDITSGTVNRLRLPSVVAFLDQLAIFTAGTEAKITGLTAIPFKAWNVTANATGDIAQFVVGASTNILARITALGWFDGAGFRVNGRQSFVNLPYMDPSFLVGLRDIPESEKAKLRVSTNFTRNVYTGVPITNTYNGQRIVLEAMEDGVMKRYEYWADEDNKWYRDFIGNV